MADESWSGFRRFVLWDYPRASWQYDVMVVLILGFIFLAPRGWFRDQPRPASIVMIEGHGTRDVWLAPELLAGVPESQRRPKAAALIRSRFGKTLTVIGIQPILDPEKEITGYMVMVQP